MNIKTAIIIAIFVIMILLVIIFPGESYLEALKMGGGAL
jgi:hypothetical protein